MARAWADYVGPRKFTDQDLDETQTNSTEAEAEPERLLAERTQSKFNRQTKVFTKYTQYLVKYVDFEPVDSTWEYGDVFAGDGQFLIDAWEETKAAEASGLVEPFDVARFEKENRLVKEERALRRDKRAEKRRIQQWLRSTPTVIPQWTERRLESVSDLNTAKVTPLSGTLSSLFEETDTKPARFDASPRLEKTQSPQQRVGVFVPHADPLSDEALSNVIVLSSDESSSASDDEPLLSRRAKQVKASGLGSATSSPPAKKRPSDSVDQPTIQERARKRAANADKASLQQAPASRETTSPSTTSHRSSGPESGEVTPASREELVTEPTTQSNHPSIALPVDPSSQPAKKPRTNIFSSWKDPKPVRKSWLNRMNGDPIPYVTKQQSTWLKLSQAKHAAAPPPPLDVPYSRSDFETALSAGDLATPTLPHTEQLPTLNDVGGLLAGGKQNAVRRLSILSPQTVRRTSEQSIAQGMGSTDSNTGKPLGPQPAIDQSKSPRSSVQSAQNSDLLPLGGRLLTCWFWANDRPCPGCVLEHHGDFEVAPEGNDLERDQMCCPHLFDRGRCFRAEAACWASHGPRPYYAMIHKGGRPSLSKFHAQYLPGRQGLGFEGDAVNDSSTDVAQEVKAAPHIRESKETHLDPISTRVAPPPLHPHEALGCFFWNMSKCYKQQDQCSYLHRKTRYVASMPPHQRPIFQSHGRAYNKHTLELLEDPVLNPPAGKPSLGQAIAPVDWENSTLDVSRESQECKMPVSLTFRPNVGQEVTCEACYLSFDDERSYSRLSNITGDSELKMICENTCATSDVRQWSSSCSPGKKLQGVIRRASADLLYVRATLQAYDLVAIFRFNDCTMFLNAIDTDPSDTALLGVSLEFCICLEQLDTQFQPALCADIDLSNIARAFGLEHDGYRPRAAYVALSQEAHSQRQELVDLLQAHQVKTYDSSTAGSWSYFVDKFTDGVVIFDSEFAAWSSVGGLCKLLASPTRVFRLQPGNNLDLMPARLFPRGVAVLLMEDCLLDFAEETLPALQQLHRRATKSITPLVLVGRPGFLHWLAMLIASRKQNNEPHLGLENIQKILFEIQNLSSHSEPNLTHEPEFDSRAQIVAPAAEDLPNYDALHTSEEFKANSDLIDWFSGWCQSRVDSLRRFVVLSMGKREWRDTWQERHGHIACLKPMEFYTLEKGYSATKKQQLEQKETAASPTNSG